MNNKRGKKLDERLRKYKEKDFPPGGKTDYVKQFDAVTSFLEKNHHTQVEKGAAVHDPDGGMFLNDHGPEHIKAVIARASEILATSDKGISPYETYLLLFAVHLHDSGNIFGRDKHEQRCRDVMNELGTMAGKDNLEKSVIVGIAAAHGGRTVIGDKDTISSLSAEQPLLGERVHPQFLAALLRFADELADDRSRASRFGLDLNAVPDASKIYHLYSQSLHSVVISPREIALEFDLNENLAKQTFSKKQNGVTRNVYLLDEIFSRTVKMHHERMYCMRYLRERSIRIDEIRVNIDVYTADYQKRLEKISYRLYETGYPASSRNEIQTLCPELKQWNGKALKEKLAKKVRRRKHVSSH